MENTILNTEKTNSTFIVANLKCSGCAKTIHNKISAIEGVDEVKVDVENARIDIQHDASIDPKQFSEKLAKIGYPKIGDYNDLLTQMKSYASCMVGKISFA
jgi:copper chaperone CopZ